MTLYIGTPCEYAACVTDGPWMFPVGSSGEGLVLLCICCQNVGLPAFAQLVDAPMCLPYYTTYNLHVEIVASRSWTYTPLSLQGNYNNLIVVASLASAIYEIIFVPDSAGQWQGARQCSGQWQGARQCSGQWQGARQCSGQWQGARQCWPVARGQTVLASGRGPDSAQASGRGPDGAQASGRGKTVLRPVAGGQTVLASGRGLDLCELKQHQTETEGILHTSQAIYPVCHGYYPKEGTNQPLLPDYRAFLVLRIHVQLQRRFGKLQCPSQNCVQINCSQNEACGDKEEIHSAESCCMFMWVRCKEKQC